MNSKYKNSHNLSKRLVMPVIKYLDNEFGTEMTDSILSELGRDRLFFDDADGYMELSEADALFSIASKVTEDDEFAYNMGRNLMKVGNRAQLFFMGAFGSPDMIYKNLNRIENRIVRTTDIKGKKLDTNTYRFTVSFREGYKEPYSACRNRYGTYESIPTLFGLPYASVKHTHCAFRGDEKCVYEVRVPDIPFIRYRNHFCIALAVGTLGFVTGKVFDWLPVEIFGISVLNISAVMVLHTLRKQFLSLKKWALQSKLALEAQMVNLKRQIELAHRIHDFTMKVNSHTEIDKVSKYATQALVDSFGFGGGMVWIIDNHGYLTCSGISEIPELEANSLTCARYSVEIGKQRHNSFISKVLESRQTVMINNPEKETVGFLEFTKNSIKELNPSSFILTPLVDRQNVLGMIVGINFKGEKVSYNDKLVFESVAPILSNALSKAKIREQLQSRIEDREIQINQRSRELNVTREMVIRSEHSSALGLSSAKVMKKLEKPLMVMRNEMGRIRSVIENISYTVSENDSDIESSQVALQLTENNIDVLCRESADTVLEAENSLEKIQKNMNILRALTQKDFEKPEKYELKNVVELVLEMISPEQLKKVDLKLEIEETASAEHKLIDLIQIILFLIANALEASNKEKNQIIVMSQTEGDRLLIKVIDFGYGISSQVEKEMMKPFFTTKNKSFHYGLGLTLTKNIVRNIGGEMYHRSESGKGTVFTVVLPRTARKGPWK